MRLRLSSAFLLVVPMILNNYVYSQDSAFVKSTFGGDFGQYFGTKLTFPMDLAFQGVAGYGEIEFRVNKSGKIDSIEVIAIPHAILANNVIETLLSTKDMWTATELNGNRIDFKYKLIVEYKTTAGSGELPLDPSIRLCEKARKSQKKEKFDEALLLVDQAIAYNPYRPEYFKLRSDLYSSIGNIEKSDTDKQTAEQMEQQLLDTITLVAYGVRR